MSVKYYDSERAASEYLFLHYGKTEPRLPAGLAESGALDFPARCVKACLDPASLPENSRALDLGCAVGRSSFELARHCVEVVGIDSSRQFVTIARHLRDNGSFTFSYCEEGDLTQSHRAIVPKDIDRHRVTFEVGDAVNPRPDLGVFDVVLAANLIDRMDVPAKFLEQLPGLLKLGGQFILTSPYTWLAEFTPRENWLGGFARDGLPVPTFDAIKKLLSPHFSLWQRLDLPFLIREHSRKFQLGISEATIWLRR
jgi:putative 4-mercaptohistidine N1-methyltranferase